MRRVTVLFVVIGLAFCHVGPAQAASPQVSNDSGASNVKDTSATLNGELTDLGGADLPDVRVYYGTTDGGTIESAWSTFAELGERGLGPLSTDVSGLTPDTTYYYRCMASNPGSIGWASASASFKTYKTGRASAPYVWRFGYDSVLAEADLLYAEMMVEKTAMGGYYCSIVGDGFYMGLQHGGAGYNKHVHFSVWDPCGDILWKASDVVTQRFGGEGTGWATYWPFEWRVNVAYRLCVRFTPRGADTLYRAYFFDPNQGTWKHLVTILRNVPNAHPNSFGSFNEDFGSQNWAARSYLVGNEWARTTDGQWADLSTGVFEVSMGWANEKAFDADANGAWFRLETGGDIVQDTPLESFLMRDSGTQPTVLPDMANHDPVAQNMSITVRRNNIGTGTLAATDEDGDVLSCSMIQDPEHGRVELSQDGTFTYWPSVNYVGQDTFTFSATDGHGGTASGTVDVVVIPPPSHPPIAVQKTGATTSYRVGDDGYYQAGAVGSPPRFTDNGDGTIQDNDTGLIWLKNANAGGNMTWPDAINYCNLLSSGTAGLTDKSSAGDWRMPNDKEMCSLLNYGRRPLLPPGSPFYNVNAWYYWVSDTMTGDGNALGLSVADGTHITWGKAVNYMCVWPVKGASTPSFPAPVAKSGATRSYQAGDDGSHQAGVTWSDPRFTDNADGTVRDNDSGLIWLKNAKPCDELGWESAIDYANRLCDGVAGLTDGSTIGIWRLPNIKELQSLLDYGWQPLLPAGNPFQDTFGLYWTSTTVPGNTSKAYSLYLFDTNTYLSAKTETHRVWAVRGPQDINHKPQPDDLSITVAKGKSYTGSLWAEDTDGDTLTFSVQSMPLHGTVSMNADGSFTYTPEVSYTGMDGFAFHVDDTAGASAAATVQIITQ